MGGQCGVGETLKCVFGFSRSRQKSHLPLQQLDLGLRHGMFDLELQTEDEERRLSRNIRRRTPERNSCQRHRSVLQ